MSLWLLYLVVIIQSQSLLECLDTAEAGASPSAEEVPQIGGLGETAAVPPPPATHEINSHTITPSDFAGAVIGQQQQQSDPQQPASDQLLPVAASSAEAPKGEQQLLPSAPRKPGDINVDLLPPVLPATTSELPASSALPAPALVPSTITVEEVTQANQQPGSSDAHIEPEDNVHLTNADGIAKGLGDTVPADSSSLNKQANSASSAPVSASTTMTVEEVVPGTQVYERSSSSGAHSEPQDTGHQTNADGSPKGLGDTAPADSSSLNKQTNAVTLTEDKGGGNGVNIVVDEITMKPLHSLEEIRQNPLEGLYTKITNEIKQYIDDVSTAWESERLVSWTVEATSYLKDYMEAISISKSVHNSYKCVEKDLKNHEDRSKAIENIIESCRSELKRESWLALQEKTSNVLSSFDKIVQNASSIIDMLNKESGLFDVVKSAVEDYAKNSLCLIDTQSLRKSLSDLKESSIKTDKEEYLKCVDSKPERSMIKDTMSDIMRIKNNCVG